MAVKDLIRKAENAGQFYELLKEEGYTLEEETAKRLFEQEKRAANEEVSEEELAVVSGGRDYATEGCAATVEYGSSCWGTDSGCFVANIEYAHAPGKELCPVCGKQTTYMSHEGVNVFYYTCRSCGSEFIDLPWRDTWLKIN